MTIQNEQDGGHSRKGKKLVKASETLCYWDFDSSFIISNI